jgi:hypothetical protein
MRIYDLKRFHLPHFRPSILFGLLSFAVFRLATALVVFVAQRFGPAANRFIGPCNRFTQAAILRSSPLGYLLSAWDRWDTCHYLLIAATGYAGHVQQSVWPPLYPALIAATGWLFKPPILSALIVSNLAALACFILFYELVAGRWGDGAARKAVWLLAAYPTAFYLVAGYTESLALAFALACFLALRKRSWVWAGVWAALSALAREQGVFLIAPILWLAYEDWRKAGGKLPTIRLPEQTPAILTAAALPGLAFAGFTAFVRFGLEDPWPWDTLTKFWHMHTGWPWQGIVGDLSLLASHALGTRAAQNFNYTATLADLVLAVACACWLIDGRRTLPGAYQVYGWLLLLVPLVKLENPSILMSVSRYTLSVFPIFVAQAQRINRKWALWAFCGVSALAQIALLVPFYQWKWVA